MQTSSLDLIDISKISLVVCVAGNDGTGKSTICKFINEQIRKKRQDIYCVQRSHKNCPKQFDPVLKQLKMLDLLTYNYAFEDERKDFQKLNHIEVTFTDQNGQIRTKKINVFWFMLDLEPEKIQARLHSRLIVDIYDTKKCVEYYSYIYRQLAWYYGIPLIYADQKTLQIIDQLLRFIDSGIYKQIESLSFQRINLDYVNERNIEAKLQQFFITSKESSQNVYQNAKKDILNSEMKDFYFNCLQFKNLFEESNESSQIQRQERLKFQQKLSARWLIKNAQISSTGNQNHALISYRNASQKEQSLQLQNIKLDLPYFKVYEQGESKILYTIHSSNPQVQNYFKGKVIILLKSTIYSHTKQHTGQIPNLGKVRALGNILFLQMMRRNNLKHAYLCINHQNGIILSQLVKTSHLEIIFKKQCLGTDKHSYHRITQIPQIVNQTNNCYIGGVYIRLDWRNPNHFVVKNQNLLINLDSYYYVVEKYFGKERFFKLFLTGQNVKAMGDKCISEDLLQNYAPTQKIKKNTLKLYSTFLYYTRKVGLEILDGCFMFDQSGQIGWSQINPDCMRVKAIKDKQDYDKDIWRYGGSSKKQQIIQKWTLFNKLFIEWFKSNRFHETDLLEIPELNYPYQQICRKILEQNNKIPLEYQHFYRQLSGSRWDKRLIGTMDISEGKPILVKSSQITESHNDQSLQKAYNHIKLLQQLVVVDIDAAIQKQGFNKNNRKQINQLISKDRNKVLAVGGGIRSQQVLEYYLNQVRCNKVILSSNLQLLDFMNKQDISQRVIVQLSINETNQILIKGRSVNTHVNINQKILQLVKYGVKTISITFNHREGHLNGIPRKQLVQIYANIPSCVQNIIIAGGITSIDDLNFIWGFKRCIPQLGSAIWKGKISIADIYSSMVKFNKQGLIPAIIVDQFQKILGQVYLNQEALRLSCQQKKLYRYSRQHQKVMKKGQTSSNVFDIIDFKLDCDNDSIIIKVSGETKKKIPDFCHKDQYSCFQEKLRKNDFKTLQAHILDRKQTGSGYSKKMMQNQGLAAMKIIEEVQELHVSQKNKTNQAADLISHLIMYFNAHNISMGQVFTELQRRSIDTIKIQNKNQQKLQINQINHQKDQKDEQKMVGIISGKHFDRIDKLAESMLGIKLVRANNRSLKIDYEIVNHELYQLVFGQGQKIKLVGIKSKDMSAIVSKKLVKSCLNYSIMMENLPTVCKQIVKIPTPGVFLALLGRKSEDIDPKKWTPQNKGIIICEYPFSLNKYFKSLGVQENCFTFIRVSGGTEAFLVSQTFKADFCDAIVQSGKTLEDNGLKVVATLQKTIYAGYYEAL